MEKKPELRKISMTVPGGKNFPSLIFPACTAVLIVLLAFLSLHMHGKYRRYREKYNLAKNGPFQQEDGKLQALASEICGKIIAGQGPEIIKFQVITLFVHLNSEHVIDGEHGEYAFDTFQALSKMYDYHMKKSGSRPHLSCGPRAAAMKALLDSQRMASRKIHVFANSGADYSSHTFIEVFNRDTGGWECWDPDFNVYYAKEDGSRAGITDLLGDCREITPLLLNAVKSEPGNGWEYTGTAHLKEKYFGAAILESTFSSIGMKDGVVLINRKKFDPDKQVGGRNFYHLVEKNYGTLRFVDVASDASTR